MSRRHHLRARRLESLPRYCRDPGTSAAAFENPTTLVLSDIGRRSALSGGDSMVTGKIGISGQSRAQSSLRIGADEGGM